MEFAEQKSREEHDTQREDSRDPLQAPECLQGWHKTIQDKERATGRQEGRQHPSLIVAGAK